ncbi:MAG: anti-sigma factor antagonist [Actinomycetia bacterium]|nr:anti-sigma factor antagonist [Actinomycetes bacterium]
MIDGGRDDSGARVVNLVGEIDIANADALGEQLDQLIGAGADRLVVDLSALDFMDSSGIAMLLRAAGRVDSMSVRNPTDAVRRIIECTGLADTLRIES